MNITMNAWICEKAMILVTAARAIVELAERVDPATMAGPAPLRELLRDEAWMVYLTACLVLAYATGAFAQDLDIKCREAFGAGPEAMRQYAQSLACQDQAGWDLPNLRRIERMEGIDAGN